MYIDFLKVTALFIRKKVNLSFFVYFLSIIFKNIDKKYHNRFFKFVTDLFKILVKAKKSKVKGVRLVISGKIKGKLRAKSHIIHFGTVSNNTLNKDINYSCVHSFTKIGAFGLKMWVSYVKKK